ncbi:mycofactocin-coupled SDR family oxidoreductase [Actinokineospora sp.]|uniref:mycofactocin-coupled SDR family oxidoreductase n=1 Tax=Actinokineospora sp. TaxID=1872133 RepID=UPI00403772B4
MMTSAPTSPVAVVTGAARGIGAATVRSLVAAGWSVVAVDSCADDPAVPYPLATRAELETLAGPRVRTAVADVRDAAALAAAVDLARTEFGGLDAAVGCAAVILGGEPVWEIPAASWRTLFDVDVGGILALARAAVPALLARPAPRRGRFVAVASAAAHHGLYHLGGYTAAKHAVLGLVRGLAADLRGTGVTAVAVSPGATDTAMLAATARIYGLPDAAELVAHQLSGRALDPDEVAAVIAWACSPDSAAVSGSVLHADGGFTG